VGAEEVGMSAGLIIGIVILGLVLVAVVVGNVVMRRQGYAIPGQTVVRCSKGHLFTTTWVEGGSLKAVRLGPRTRYQRCPEGRHWAIVHPVKDQDLTDEDRRALTSPPGPT
jgi:hypothetical protein